VIAAPAAYVPALDLFAPGSAAVLVLFGLRVGGLVLVAPVFSARTIPMAVKTGLVLILTVLMQPAALASVRTVPQLTPAAALNETLVGFAIGMGAALLVGATEAAGELIGIQIGLSGAALFDPLNNTQGTAIGQFMQLFAVSLLLAFNAHLVMLDALATSVQAVPVGSPLEVRHGLAALISLGGTLFALGLRFAAPVIAAVLVANVALAVLGRAAPQLNILSVAFPIQIGIGLFTLAAALPFIATWFTGWEGTYDGALTRVMAALTEKAVATGGLGGR
jgi:flagellar biosynthesis protein FliR